MRIETDGRKKKKRAWTPGFKLAAVSRMDEAVDVAALAEELGVGVRRLYEWRQRYRVGGAAALRQMGRPPVRGLSAEGLLAPPSQRADEQPAGRIAELERKVGQQQLDLDFFRAALRHVEARRHPNDTAGVTASTRRSTR